MLTLPAQEATEVQESEECAVFPLNHVKNPHLEEKAQLHLQLTDQVHQVNRFLTWA
jgi:hypothetical protein